MATKSLLAIDIGAESGRAIVGKFDGRALALEECTRFSNGAQRLGRLLHWDLLGLWRNVQDGISAARPHKPASVGIDTWGVDFGFLDKAGNLAGLPVSHRDDRTLTILDDLLRVVPREELYRLTGIQIMRFNSLMQLAAMWRDGGDRAFDGFGKLLFVPDLLHWLLTGVVGAETTIASTGQFLGLDGVSWNADLVGRIGVPAELLPPLIPTTTRLGAVRSYLRDRLGDVDVVASACHDTAAAVAAVPATGADWCYISSGTWSLMGAEIPSPLVGADAMAANFTNERGVGGTIRLLKNIMGLWLVQGVRASLAKVGDAPDYAAMTAAAADSSAFRSLIDPDDGRFLNPPDMAEAIRAFCAETGQPAPSSAGELVRCCLESLALRYRRTLAEIEAVVGRRMAVVHVVGGGSQNAVLCQMTADACRRPVLAGPVEATAAGNCMVQAMALGDLSSLAEVREVVRASGAVVRYAPKDGGPWDDAYSRFRSLAKFG